MTDVPTPVPPPFLLRHRGVEVAVHTSKVGAAFAGMAITPRQVTSTALIAITSSRNLRFMFTFPFELDVLRFFRVGAKCGCATASANGY